MSAQCLYNHLRDCLLPEYVPIVTALEKLLNTGRDPRADRLKRWKEMIYYKQCCDVDPLKVRSSNVSKKRGGTIKWVQESLDKNCYLQCEDLLDFQEGLRHGGG